MEKETELKVVGQLNFLIEINYQKKFGQYFALLT
jgi:hypothetical protein